MIDLTMMNVVHVCEHLLEAYYVPQVGDTRMAKSRALTSNYCFCLFLYLKFPPFFISASNRAMQMPSMVVPSLQKSGERCRKRVRVTIRYKNGKTLDSSY